MVRPILVPIPRTMKTMTRPHPELPLRLQQGSNRRRRRPQPARATCTRCLSPPRPHPEIRPRLQKTRPKFRDPHHSMAKEEVRVKLRPLSAAAAAGRLSAKVALHQGLLRPKPTSMGWGVVMVVVTWSICRRDLLRHSRTHRPCHLLSPRRPGPLLPPWPPE